MLSTKEIKSNLTLLNGKYISSAQTDPKEAYFYSKLAILELCGWIEMMMDGIIEDKCHKMTGKKEIISAVKITLKKINGFQYNEHFSKMLVQLLGIVGYYNLESKIDAAKLTVLKSNLNKLKEIRNHCAHTYTHGTLRTINTPTITLSLLKPIFDGLKEFENKLTKI